MDTNSKKKKWPIKLISGVLGFGIIMYYFSGVIAEKKVEALCSRLLLEDGKVNFERFKELAKEESYNPFKVSNIQAACVGKENAEKVFEEKIIMNDVSNGSVLYQKN